MRFLVVFAIVVFAGCLSAPAPAGPSDSGIYGVAMIGPTCPVMRDPPDPDCRDQPFEGEFAITNVEGSRVIKTFSSNAEGAFNVSLEPGEYAIRLARESSSPPTCANVEPVRVSAEARTLVNVTCDSGIR